MEANPLVKALKWTAGLFLLFVVGLYTLGFIIGLSGQQSVTFDPSNMLKNLGTSEEEVPAPAPSRVATPSEKPSPTASPSAVPSKAPTPPSTSAPSRSISEGEREAAQEAGRAAGEAFKAQGQKDLEAFWEAFNGAAS